MHASGLHGSPERYVLPKCSQTPARSKHGVLVMSIQSYLFVCYSWRVSKETDIKRKEWTGKWSSSVCWRGREQCLSALYQLVVFARDNTIKAAAAMHISAQFKSPTSACLMAFRLWLESIGVAVTSAVRENCTMFVGRVVVPAANASSTWTGHRWKTTRACWRRDSM